MQMEDPEEILEHARSSNAPKNITGALVYVDGVFLQVLEGDPKAVQELMARISSDVRHETVTILKQQDLPAAIFNDWKMAYISATAEQVAKWAGLSGTTAVQDVLANLRNDPLKATQVAESILSVLVAEPSAKPTAE